jgi:hypothetical protein
MGGLMPNCRSAKELGVQHMCEPARCGLMRIGSPLAGRAQRPSSTCRALPGTPAVPPLVAGGPRWGRKCADCRDGFVLHGCILCA